MRSQRLFIKNTPAVNAAAEALPFDDHCFEASMAIVTIHHWPGIAKGLKDLRKVTKNQVVIMTFDPDSLHQFWNAAYFPELIEVERQRYPSIQLITDVLDGKSEVQKIPIPRDCVDGFQEAFYARPDAFLREDVRQAQSAWGFLSELMQKELIDRLQKDLQSGEWDKKYGHFRKQPNFTGALRLIVSKR